MKRTAIYVRVSSDKQAQEGDSIPAQLDALHKYIDSRDDLICAGEYMDDGISGTKADRDELTRLLDDVKAGKIDLILFTKLDRWFRSVRHYTATQAILDKYRVDWKAIWESIYDTTTPQGRLIINQMMSIAQFEAENTGQRIRQVQAYKVQKGEVISGQTPPGYSIQGKRMIPNDIAPAVVDAFKTYAFTGSIRETMRQTQGRGLPKCQQAFRRMLTNEKYTGTFRGNDDFCPSIIDKELFADVQRKLSMNVKQSQKHTYIFSGLIKCAVCGRSMGANRRLRHRKTISYHENQYRCAGYYNGGVKRCTNAKLISEGVLERYLVETIRPQIEGMVLQIEIDHGKPADHKKQIAAIRGKMDRLKELYVNDLISLDEYKTDKERYAATIEELEKQQAVDVGKYKELLETDIESLYAGMTAEEKRFFWRSIIKEIRFGTDRKYQVIFL